MIKNKASERKTTEKIRNFHELWKKFEESLKKEFEKVRLGGGGV